MSFADTARLDAAIDRIAALERRILALEGNHPPQNAPSFGDQPTDFPTLPLKRGPGRPRKDAQ